MNKFGKENIKTTSCNMVKNSFQNFECKKLSPAQGLHNSEYVSIGLLPFKHICHNKRVSQDVESDIYGLLSKMKIKLAILIHVLLIFNREVD